jgi:hypothetical protein
MGQNAPAEATEVFAGITPPPNVYVTDPQATGWGDTWNGARVVRLPLYADAVYQAGELVATTGHVAQAIASQLPGIVYSNSVSALTIYTNASGAATSWWQVARGVTNSGSFASGTPGVITNGQTGPLTLGQMQMIENGNVGFGGTPETDTGWPLTVTGSSRFNGWVYVGGGMILTDSFVYNAGGYAFKTWNGDLIDAVSWSSAGNVSMPSGNLTVAKTNTAAAFVTTGTVSAAGAIYQAGELVATTGHVAQAIAAIPEWLVYTNISAAVTVTNDLERPVRIYGDGSATGTVSFAALREPLPVYVEASGFPGIVWSNAYTVGGGFWQTNAVNVFLIWQSGTNTFVNPVTARPL